LGDEVKLGAVFPQAFPKPETERDIAGLTMDSRQVAPGFAFVALAGSKTDGIAFVSDAVRKGAIAVVAEASRPTDLPPNIAYAQVGDARRELALAAARLYAPQPETVVAVTGTAGKTSVADFARQIFTTCGRQAASLGTIGIVAPSGPVYGALTTPDPVSLHQTLARLAAQGVTHLAMEASSHGLDQRRLDGVELKAAAFTNLGRDHLDYHPTMDAYLAAKVRLFDTLLPDDATAVINSDSPEGAEILTMVAMRGLPTLAVGTDGDLQLIEVETEGFAQQLRIRFGGETYRFKLPLVGAFQVCNALVAAGLALAVGEDPGHVFGALRFLKGVKGRLERVAEINGALVIVDYAHKPDALAQALDALRPFTAGRLVCVLGCGGDRDPGKRPIMGRIAVEKADVVIVTDDNPRTEDPKAIRTAILAGARGAKEIGDRAEAIHAAVHGLRRGDVLVVAGKGHETGQIVGTKTLPFSDHQEIRDAIEDIEP
jgi:UDP-N-acetylmuramoyl-L-alanyl-D-glutamate--2,6-diaminopimelate ligase